MGIEGGENARAYPNLSIFNSEYHIRKQKRKGFFMESKLIRHLPAPTPRATRIKTKTPQ